jgi:hypothetical protein
MLEGILWGVISTSLLMYKQRLEWENKTRYDYRKGNTRLIYSTLPKYEGR